MKIKTNVKLLSMVFLALSGILILSSRATADINIKFQVANPRSEKADLPVKYYLPVEIKKEDVLDTANLTLDYDVDKASFFVEGSVALDPGATRDFQVKVRDVWKVKSEYADEIKKQINESLSRLVGNEYYDQAKKFADKMNQKIDFIMEQQTSYADNVELRIEQYRTYISDLAEIRKNATSISYWKDNRFAEQQDKTIKFIVEVANPDKEKNKNVKQQHYLPSEINPEDIVDKQGFDVRYDVNKSRSYLSKEEDLAPGEKKRYEFTIRDKWNIPEDNLGNVSARSDDAMSTLKGTVFEASAQYLFDSIQNHVKGIKDSQSEKKGIKDHIGAFRANAETFEKTEDDLKSLEELVLAFKEDLERSKLKNVLQQIKALRSIADIAQAIFGKKPSVNTFWRIVTGIMITVGLLTFIHFMIWGRRSREAKLKKMQQQQNNPANPQDQQKVAA